MVELEGLINRISCALQSEKTPSMVEGDSRIIINIARRLQHGATTSQVLNNWRWEGHLSELKRILAGPSAILFSHVRRYGNKLEDALENKGVESRSPFHAKEFDNNRNRSLWERCKNLVHEDMESMTEEINHQTQLTPQ